MSDPWFLVAALPDSNVYTLDGPEGHHAATVQRLRVGESLVLADGRGGTVPATVTAVAKGALTLAVGTASYEAPPAVPVTVVQGIAKGDRSELAIQAMTEVGVDTIVPWSAARSIAQWKPDRSHQRWTDTVREAAKQSHRSWVPTVTDAVRTPALGPGSFVLHESATARLSTVELPDGGLTLVVGPEGGITPEELAAFSAAGASVVRLGPSVLRTSTAGPAALAVLSARLGRW